MRLGFEIKTRCLWAKQVHVKTLNKILVFQDVELPSTSQEPKRALSGEGSPVHQRWRDLGTQILNFQESSVKYSKNSASKGSDLAENPLFQAEGVSGGEAMMA